jgi:hypothetical protein
VCADESDGSVMDESETSDVDQEVAVTMTMVTLSLTACLVAEDDDNATDGGSYVYAPEEARMDLDMDNVDDDKEHSDVAMSDAI